MATAVFLAYQQTIVQLLLEGCTYKEVSSYLTEQTGRSSGLSSRSLRRYCTTRGIWGNRGRVTQEHLDRTVHIFVQTVGHSYRRRMMHGILASQGIQVSQRRVRELLRVAPIQYVPRQCEATLLLNPVPYRATYFGEKIHLDQAHVVAVDGYSRKIVGLITIPKKNPILIYNLIFLPLLHSQGLWDQVCVDHGTEFALIISAQKHVTLTPKSKP